MFLILRLRQRDLFLLFWRDGAACKHNLDISAQMQLQNKK